VTLAKPAARTSKAGVAGDVWGRILDYFIANARHVELARELGLTPGDTKLLLDLSGEPRSMRTLAEAFACDASNITWMVDRLEERGFAERRTLATDRRVKTVILTPLGEKTRGELIENMYEPPKELVDLSRDDLDRLRAAVDLLPDAPSKYPRDA
jgi:DNA-binding MarR family transcriptional regulator